MIMLRYLFTLFGGLRMDTQFRSVQDNIFGDMQDLERRSFNKVKRLNTHRRMYNTRCSELWYRHVETLNTMRNNLHILDQSVLKHLELNVVGDI